MVHGATEGERKRCIVSANLFALPAKVAHTSGGVIAAQQQDANQQAQRYDKDDSDTIDGLRQRAQCGSRI